MLALTIYLGIGGPGGAERLRQSNGADASGEDVSGRQWIDLADGSRLGVEDAAEVHVLEQAEVRVRLVSGKVNVQVAKQHGQDWVLVAGPYRVAVIGTQFDVSFDASSEGFEVRVTEGLVRVFGGDLPKDGLSLREGQGYAATGSVVPSPVAPSPVVPSPVVPLPLGSVSAETSSGVSQAPKAVWHQLTPSVAPPSPRPLTMEPGSAEDVGLPPASPTWRQSCAAGRYSEAFSPGNIENFQGLLEQSVEGELLQLANCLRYAGRSSEAGRALTKLRDRFPRSPGAILASFHLARLSQREANTDLAIRWFATYLTESPKGQLAASARAELVRLWLQQGNTVRARAAARDYLRLHPKGSFARQARELLHRAATSQ